MHREQGGQGGVAQGKGGDKAGWGEGRGRIGNRGNRERGEGRGDVSDWEQGHKHGVKHTCDTERCIYIVRK